MSGVRGGKFFRTEARNSDFCGARSGGGREIELPQGVMVEGAGEGPRGGGQSRASGHVRGVARAGGSGCGSRWFAAHPAGRQPFS